MFKPVNHTSRFPAVLQSGTKENVVFQLTLAVVYIGVMIVKDKREERRFQTELEMHQFINNVV